MEGLFFGGEEDDAMKAALATAAAQHAASNPVPDSNNTNNARQESESQVPDATETPTPSQPSAEALNSAPPRFGLQPMTSTEEPEPSSTTTPNSTPITTTSQTTARFGIQPMDAASSDTGPSSPAPAAAPAKPAVRFGIQPMTVEEPAAPSAPSKPASAPKARFGIQPMIMDEPAAPVVEESKGPVVFDPPVKSDFDSSTLLSAKHEDGDDDGPGTPRAGRGLGAWLYGPPTTGKSWGAIRTGAMEEDTNSTEWASHKKHVFVLSSAGKPVYSRYGDESKLSGLMGVIQALVSFLHDDNNDEIRSMHAGEHKFVFLEKGPLYLVIVAHTSAPTAALTQNLEVVHSCLVSILTGTFAKKFERSAQFDIRGLLTGAEKFLDSITHRMDADPGLLLEAVRALRLTPVARKNAGLILSTHKRPDMQFAMIVSRGQIVSSVRHKSRPLPVSDVHLILNFLDANPAFADSESWSPICLPAFNDKGYLHAYICYLTVDTVLVILGSKMESFMPFAEAKVAIAADLESKNTLKAIEQSVGLGMYTIHEVGVPGLRHFLYKDTAKQQYTCPRLQAPYTRPEARETLFRAYEHLVHRMRPSKQGDAVASEPLRLMYTAFNGEAMLGWVTPGFEVYAAFDPLSTKAFMVSGVNKLVVWVRNMEAQLFLSGAPMW